MYFQKKRIRYRAMDSLLSAILSLYVLYWCVYVLTLSSQFFAPSALNTLGEGGGNIRKRKVIYPPVPRERGASRMFYLELPSPPAPPPILSS